MSPQYLPKKTVNKAAIEHTQQTITCQKCRVTVVSTVGKMSDQNTTKRDMFGQMLNAIKQPFSQLQTSK